MSTHIGFIVPLTTREAQLILLVLSESAERVHVVQEADDRAELTLSAVTLGRLMTLFGRLLEPGTAPASPNLVIDVTGERLYGPRLTLEGWDLVCAHLGRFAAQAVLESDDETLAGQNDLSRAHEALDLMRRITEATSER